MSETVEAHTDACIAAREVCIARLDACTAKLVASIRSLQEAEDAANEITARVQQKYSDSMSYLADMVRRAGEGNFAPPPGPPPGFPERYAALAQGLARESKIKKKTRATQTVPLEAEDNDDAFAALFAN